MTAPWLKQPKYMPDWFYAYFGEVMKPLITMKEDRHLAAPPSFTARDTARSNFWINPLKPAILLSRRRFEPTALYRPRIFLWLPHFLVEILYCPTCKMVVLEKKGVIRPAAPSPHCWYGRLLLPHRLGVLLLQGMPVTLHILGMCHSRIPSTISPTRFPSQHVYHIKVACHTILWLSSIS